MDAAIETWCRLVITSIWTYSEKLWQFRNQVVYGRTTTFRVSKAVAGLRARATELYEQFTTDPHMLPSSWIYLFHCPLKDTLTLDKDALAGWIRLVEEGLYTREHREKLAAAALKRTLKNFFRPKQHSTKPGPHRRQSMWKPPFSGAYYKRHQPSK